MGGAGGAGGADGRGLVDRRAIYIHARPALWKD